MADSSFFLESGVFYPFDSSSGNIGGGGTLGQLAIWAGSNLLGSVGPPSGTALDTITGFSDLGVLQRTGAGAYAFLGINVPNGVVQLTSVGKLPTLDGSLLTNLTSAALSGALPALNGSALTSLTAANLLGALPAISGAALTSITLTGEVTTSGVAATINKAITPTWTGQHNFNGGVWGKMGTPLAPYTAPVPASLYFSQDFASGTMTGGNFNSFLISDRQIGNIVYGWSFIHALLAGAGGNRNTFSSTFTIAGTPSNPTVLGVPQNQQSAGIFTGQVSAGIDAGGSALFALNPQVVVNKNVTNLASGISEEIDLYIGDNVTSIFFEALRIATLQIDSTNTTGSRGTHHTAGIHFLSAPNTMGFSHLLLVGAAFAGEQNPFGLNTSATGGTVLGCMGAPTFKYGIDFTNAAPIGTDASAGFAFVSPGFSVNWLGKISTLISNDYGITLLSGGLGNFTGIALGRTSVEVALGVCGGAAEFFPSSLQGDICFSSAVGNVLIGTTTAGLALKILTGANVLAATFDSSQNFISAGSVTGTSHKVGSNQVVGARVTGYTAMTGTADKASIFATGSVTLAQLAGRVMQLQADLTTHGLIGT